MMLSFTTCRLFLQKLFDKGEDALIFQIADSMLLHDETVRPIVMLLTEIV